MVAAHGRSLGALQKRLIIRFEFLAAKTLLQAVLNYDPTHQLNGVSKRGTDRLQSVLGYVDKSESPSCTTKNWLSHKPHAGGGRLMVCVLLSDFVCAVHIALALV